MAANDFGSVIRFIRRTLVPKEAAEAEDARLLRQFADGRDEAAFTALVRRHGPMV